MLDYRFDDLNLMVSLFCPGRCLNCNLWRAERPDVTKDEMPLQVIDGILQSRLLSTAFYFDLTAGESQLSPKYVDIVRLIAQRFGSAFLHTNVSGWYPEKHFEVTRECLEYVDPSRFRIDVSLDGSPETYGKVRLVPSGWEKARKTIGLLRDLGIVLRVVFIVHKQNYQDIEWFVNFAEDLGIGWYVGFSRQANLLNNVNATDIDFTPRELDRIESALERIGYLETRRKSSWLWARSVYEKRTVRFECHMGRRALVIDPYGNVFPCNDLVPSLNMGNVAAWNGDLDALLSSERAVEVLHRVQGGQCQPCTMLCAHKLVFPWGNHTGMPPTGCRKEKDS
ncbi:MAG: radical SAM protein [Acidobacteriota bacterium]